MKKVNLILACLLILGVTSSHSQSAVLVCDSTTYRYDTIKAEKVIYLDTKSNTVKVADGYAVQKTCRLMYKGTGGAPSAPTNQAGVESTKYFADKQEVQEKYVIRFITK